MEINQPGGFGRRGSSLAGVDQAPQTLRFIEGRSLGWKQVVWGLALALVAIVTADGLFSGTSLITPIDETFLDTMGIIGGILGVPLAFAVVLFPHEPIGLVKKILIVLFLPVMCWFSGMMLAWRVADWAEFGLSSAPFVEARYPVTFQSPSTRLYERDSFEINPFKVGGLDIPVPSDQFDAAFPHGSDMCITVMQRKSPSGAIEVRTDGVLNLSDPEPVKLSPCPEALADN